MVTLSYSLSSIATATAIILIGLTGCDGSSYPYSETNRTSPAVETNLAALEANTITDTTEAVAPIQVTYLESSTTRNNIQNNDTENNDTENNDTENNDTENNDTENNDTENLNASGSVNISESTNNTATNNTATNIIATDNTSSTPFYQEVALPRGAWRFERNFNNNLPIDTTNSTFTVDTTFIYQFISAPTLDELAQYPLCFTGFTGVSIPTFNGITPSDTPTRFGTIHNIEPRSDCENPVQTVNNHSNSLVDISTTCSNNRNEHIQISQISTTPLVQAGSFSVSGSFGNFSEENNVCGYSVESNQVTNHESNTIEDEETNTRAYEILASKQNQKAKLTIELANISELGTYPLGMTQQTSDSDSDSDFDFDADMNIEVRLEVDVRNPAGETETSTADSVDASTGSITITNMSISSIEGNFTFTDRVTGNVIGNFSLQL